MKTKRKPNPPKRITKEEKADRVLRMILDGNSWHDVLTQTRQQFPNDDPADIITSAVANLEAASRYDSAILIGWCLEATRDVYRKMVADGDHVGALRAIRQLADLSKHVPENTDETEEEETEQAPPTDSRAIPAGEGPCEQGESAADSERPGDRADTAGEESGA